MPPKGTIVKELNCLSCGEKSPDKFFGAQKSRCRTCQSKLNEQNRVQRRLEGISYLGGKCAYCGYDKCRAALEFHHLDPDEKDPVGLDPARSKKKFFEELDKCILLCSNCHREEHYKVGSESVP